MSAQIRLLVFGLLILLICALAYSLITPVTTKRVELDELNDRIERHREALSKLENRSDVSVFSPDLIVVGSRSTVSLNLQQSLSGIIRDTEGRLERMRQLRAEPRGDGDAPAEIRIEVQWQGDLQSILETLKAIDDLRPAVFAEEFTMTAGGRAREDRNIRAEAVLVTLWSPDEGRQ